MQRLTFTFLFILLLDGCKMLGVGKQCYTCTTTASKGGISSTSSKEICGLDEMRAYQKNSGLINGVYTSINCVEK